MNKQIQHLNLFTRSNGRKNIQSEVAHRHLLPEFYNCACANATRTYAYLKCWMSRAITAQLPSQLMKKGLLRARVAGTCTLMIVFTGMKCSGFDWRAHADNDVGVDDYNFRVITHHSDAILGDCAQSLAISHNCYRYLLQMDLDIVDGHFDYLETILFLHIACLCTGICNINRLHVYHIEYQIYTLITQQRGWFVGELLCYVQYISIIHKYTPTR